MIQIHVDSFFCGYFWMAMKVFSKRSITSGQLTTTMTSHSPHARGRRHFRGTNSLRMFLAMSRLFCVMASARTTTSRSKPSLSSWLTLCSVRLSQRSPPALFSLLLSWDSRRRSRRAGSGADDEISRSVAAGGPPSSSVRAPPELELVRL